MRHLAILGLLLLCSCTAAPPRAASATGTVSMGTVAHSENAQVVTGKGGKWPTELTAESFEWTILRSLELPPGIDPAYIEPSEQLQHSGTVFIGIADYDSGTWRWQDCSGELPLRIDIDPGWDVLDDDNAVTLAVTAYGGGYCLFNSIVRYGE